jgi:cell division protein FtsZ
MSTEEISSVPETHSSTFKVSIVGIGGAGNNLVTGAITRGIDPKHCVAVNNDTGQLSRSPAPNKVFLGAGITKNEWESSSTQSTKLLQTSAHRVTPFTKDADFTILVAGLGGATATATAPLIAQYNRTLVKPVVSIVAIPFLHERERRFIALRGLKKMVDSCDCTIVIDNSMESNSVDSPEDRIADSAASLHRTMDQTRHGAICGVRRT